MAIFEVDKSQPDRSKQNESREVEESEIIIGVCILGANLEAPVYKLWTFTRPQKVARAIKTLCSLSLPSVPTSLPETGLNDGDKGNANSATCLDFKLSLGLRVRAKSSSFAHRPRSHPAPGLGLHSPQSAARHLLPSPVHPTQVSSPSRSNEIPYPVIKNLAPFKANLPYPQQFAVRQQEEQRAVI